MSPLGRLAILKGREPSSLATNPDEPLPSLFVISSQRPPPDEQPPAGEGELRCLPISEGDAALVAALRSGHAGAPSLLVERYGRYVERLLTRVVGLDPELPDLLHEVFVRALQCIHELRAPGALKGWLGSMALFTARAWLRERASRRRWVSLLAPSELPERPAAVPGPEVNEALRRTYAILNTIGTEERIVFALRFVDGMSLGEIAEVTGASLSTVKRRLGRAKERFVKLASQDAALRDRLAGSPRWREE